MLWGIPQAKHVVFTDIKAFQKYTHCAWAQDGLTVWR